MLPNSIRVMNHMDVIPRHPVMTGFLGVGTHYLIDKKGGCDPADTVYFLRSMIGNLTDPFKNHYWQEYLNSFRTAAGWFNAENMPEAVFDLSLGIVTAAYAFEAYATPVRHQFSNFQPISYDLSLSFTCCDDEP